MIHRMKIAALVTVLASVMAGCHQRQARLDALQKDYDRAGMQFQKDCSAEYLKNPPTLSPKCSDEKTELETVGKRLRAERSKQ